MAAQTWAHVAARKAKEICAALSLHDSASALLDDDPAPAQFLERLLEVGDFKTALTFMAFALPARQAVWWGCLCLEIARGNNLSAREEQALRAAVRWVLEPTETHRQAANAPPADAAGLATPAGNLAKAAFWSGGSMLPPGQPVLAPPPVLRPQAVCRAVTALAGEAAAAHRERAYRQLLAIATGIACDRHRWPKG